MIERRTCPKCGFEQAVQNEECPRCGVVFAKLNADLPDDSVHESGPPHQAKEGWFDRVLELALAVPPSTSGFELGARALLWMALLAVTWNLVWSDLERSQISANFAQFVLSRANLVFHEAGHLLFRPFGEFMTALGGSLLQVLIPLGCAAVFLLRYENPFGASVTAWWAGESLIEVAPYINDARSQRLILLGGVTGQDVPGYHDWNNLLGRLDLLEYDQALAKLTHLAGTGLIVLAAAWGAHLLIREYQILKAPGPH